jgi:thiol-disulfide isomerase/thioredoxin
MSTNQMVIRCAVVVAIVTALIAFCIMTPGGVVAPFLVDRGGSEIDLYGETTILFFVTPGCSACKSMYEDINELSKGGVRVIAVGVGYEYESEMEFFPLVQKIVLDDEGRERYGLWAYPTIIFVGRYGTIMYRTTGVTSGLGLWWRLALTDALGV